MNPKIEHEEVREIGGIQKNSNSVKENEHSGEELIDSINLVTRTKTANFNQNGYSNELFKIINI